MPLVLPLVPGQRSTPEAVVVKEVQRYVALVVVAINVLTTKRCSRRMRRDLVFWSEVTGIAKGFELVVEDDANARDLVPSGVFRRGGRRYQI